MSKDKFEERKRVVFLLIHYVLMILFVSLALVSLWSGVHEFIFVNSLLGLVVYIESIKFLPKNYFKDRDFER